MAQCGIIRWSERMTLSLWLVGSGRLALLSACRLYEAIKKDMRDSPARYVTRVFRVL